MKLYDSWKVLQDDFGGGVLIRGVKRNKIDHIPIIASVSSS